MTMQSELKRPLISIVIIAYNMAREIPRTVFSFLPPYQHEIDFDDIEIIVMENGSSHPVDPEVVRSWPDCVRYIEVENPHPSPARALNQGVAMCKGDWVCPVIDGARLISPGVLKSAHELIKAHENPIIATTGYHLGHKTQQMNVLEGYNQQAEDALLASIDWPNNPYDLFEISCLGGSARKSWFSQISESNVLVLKKEFYNVIGGFDENFDIPGGGLVNLDFFKRCADHESSQYIMLLGEGSFHQYHGGVTTSRAVSLPSLKDASKTTWQIYAEQYLAIRGEPYQSSQTYPLIYGEANPVVRKQTIKAALYIDSLNKNLD